MITQHFERLKVGYKLMVNGLGEYYVTKMTNGRKSFLEPNKERGFFHTREEAEAAIQSDYAREKITQAMNTWETIETYHDWEEST